MDVSGIVRKLRRLADLSQRDLAAAMGVHHAQIARIEGGSRSIDVAQLERMLALAGLRLVVVDANGETAAPVPAGGFRDSAGRRVPAHLDVRAPFDPPASMLLHTRGERRDPAVWYERREARDRCRRRLGLGSDDEQLTHEGLERLRSERRRRNADRIAPSDAAWEICDCPVDCWDTAGCSAACTCRCEAS